MVEPGQTDAARKARASEARPQSFRGQGCRGKVGRCLWRFLQQPESRNTLYLRVYTKVPQVICAICVSLIFLILGGVLYSFSGNPVEVVISYSAGDTTKSFTISQALTGTVQVHYEIPSVLLNNKDYVSSKDKDSVYTFFSTVTCSNADTIDWAQKRRGSDSAFMARLSASGSDSLAPCGLVNIALFTDSYVLERDLGSSWEAISIDESRVALPADDESFNKVSQENGTIYLRNNRLSWLTPDLVEHWKVWQRTPPGQIVRNLWGYIEGGLQLGSYRITFAENSGVWEEWGVPEKRLIITGNPSWLGNPGAIQTAAGTMFFLAGAELILLVVFVMLVFNPPSSAPREVDGSSEVPELEPAARVPEARPPKEPVHSVRV